MLGWLEPQPVVIPEPLLEAAGGSHLVAARLLRQGISTAEQARAFLDPACYSDTDPSELPGMEAGLAAIQVALAEKRPILVWGDFDVDGQTSTTILVETLQSIGAQVAYHIPLRESEGHGVSPTILQGYLAAQPYLILTCDTGISAAAAADTANERGVPLVITDHHDPPENLPHAAAIINPKLGSPAHPFYSLSGAGIAFELAEALLRENGHPESADHLLDLAAMGLVADVAELRGEARYLVQSGLSVLRSPSRLGLLALCERVELNPARINEEHIGFLLAPPLNALGRLADANLAVEFLTTKDMARARALALHLQGLNERRKFLTDQVYKSAREQLERDPHLLDTAALVLFHPEWPGGVLGIVASQLVEDYARPALLLSVNDSGQARGSARSVAGINISAAIQSCQGILSSFGGHPMAAGVSLPLEKIPDLCRCLDLAVRAQSGESPQAALLQIDGYLPFAELTLDLAAELEQLAPFGSGNPPLVFAAQGCRITRRAKLGRESEHLLLTVQDQAGSAQRVLYWNAASHPVPEDVFDLAYTLRATSYRGQPELQVEWIGYRIIQTSTELVSPPRLPIAAVDHRRADHPLGLLAAIQAEGYAQIWAEGPDREKSGGSDRFSLLPAPRLVIWHRPASQSLLAGVLHQTQAEEVFLFAIDPGMDEKTAFTRRLAGLVKFALSAYGGQADLERLAAACAQTIENIGAGLAWMQAQGFIRLGETQGTLQMLYAGSGLPTSDSGEKTEQLARRLAETRAYRNYYTWANPERLLNPESG